MLYVATSWPPAHAFEAIAMVAIAVYAELRVALYVIQWLALHRH
jgi:hypothetical protein